MFLLEEPKSFQEIVKEYAWKLPMEEELPSIQKNQTWDLVSPHENCKPIGLKWIFKVKKNAKGELIRDKGRLVAKGYSQCYGIDCEDYFALMARFDPFI